MCRPKSMLIAIPCCYETVFYYVIATFLQGTGLINNADYLGNSSKRKCHISDKAFNF